MPSPSVTTTSPLCRPKSNAKTTTGTNTKAPKSRKRTRRTKQCSDCHASFVLRNQKHHYRRCERCYRRFLASHSPPKSPSKSPSSRNYAKFKAPPSPPSLASYKRKFHNQSGRRPRPPPPSSPSNSKSLGWDAQPAEARPAHLIGQINRVKCEVRRALAIAPSSVHVETGTIKKTGNGHLDGVFATMTSQPTTTANETLQTKSVLDQQDQQDQQAQQAHISWRVASSVLA